MYELIQQKIRSAANAILFYMAQGWSEAEAIAYVRNQSTLGPSSWASVLKLVAAGQEA